MDSVYGYCWDEKIKNLKVTVRNDSRLNKPANLKMSVRELNERISNETSGFLYKGLPLPELLSARPRFV